MKLEMLGCLSCKKKKIKQPTPKFRLKIKGQKKEMPFVLSLCLIFSMPFWWFFFFLVGTRLLPTTVGCCQDDGKHLLIKKDSLMNWIVGSEFSKMCKYLNARYSFLSLVNRCKFSNHSLPRRVNSLSSWHTCYLQKIKRFSHMSAQSNFIYLFIKICFSVEQFQIQDFYSAHQMISQCHIDPQEVLTSLVLSYILFRFLLKSWN